LGFNSSKRKSRGIKAIHARNERLKGGKENTKRVAEDIDKIKEILFFFNVLVIKRQSIKCNYYSINRIFTKKVL